MCVHVYMCGRLSVSALAWRSLYRPKQNSLVERSYQSHVRGGEEERVRGDDKWLGHTSRN